MRKYALWSAIIGLPLGGILIIAGAWLLINHQEGANDFFKGGVILLVSSLLWYLLLSRKRVKQNI